MSEDYFDAVTVECGPTKWVHADGGPTQYRLMIECKVQLPEGPQDMIYRGDLTGEFAEWMQKSAEAAGVDMRSDDPHDWTLTPGKAVRVKVKEGKRGKYIAGIYVPKQMGLDNDDRAAMRAAIAASRGRTAPQPARTAATAPRVQRQSEPESFAQDQDDSEIPF